MKKTKKKTKRTRRTVLIPNRLMRRVENLLSMKEISFNEYIIWAIQDHLKKNEVTFEDIMDFEYGFS